MTRKHLWLRPVGWLPILALLQVVMSAAPAKAQTIIDWIDPNGGPYTNVANWSPANVPNTTSETARFDIVGTYDVTFNANSTTAISDLLVNQVNDGDVTFANGGINNDATLNINDDALIDGGDLTLARLVGGTADVNLNITDFLQVNGGSTFSVLESAAVTANRMSIGTSPTGNGTMIVDGAGSALIVGTLTSLGTSGSIGTLTFQNGSTGNSLSGTVNLMVGSGVVGSTGRLNVFGGSTLQTGNIAIGQSASNTLVQEGTLTIDGVDSTITMTGASTLTVGDDVNPNVVSDVIISNSGVMSSGAGAILIRNSGTLTITDGTFNANGALTMTAGTTLTLDGGSLNANVGLDNSAAGTLDFRDGTLTVTGGAFQPNAGGPSDDYVIDGPTATEIPHLVLGTGATGSLSHDIYVGNANQGMLTFSGGGTFSSRAGLIGFDPNSIGMVTVEGSDPNGIASTWMNSSILTVGDAGDGTLTIQNGGAVSNTIGTIGEDPDATGTVTVDGASSIWTNSSILIVGFAGNGTLTIQNGGTVSNTLLSHIASDPNSIGMVTVDGSDPNGNASTWTNSGLLVVGNKGNGTLNIQNGGAVSNVGDAFVGNNLNSTGTVTVDGAGSTWTNSTGLYVGGNSASAGDTGTLNVQNSGLVEVDGTLKIWAPGTVTLDGGTLKVDSTAVVVEGTLNYITGTFHLTDAGGYTVGANSGPIDQALGGANVTTNSGGLIVDQNLIVPLGTSLTAVTSVVTANGLTNDGLIIITNGTLTTTSGLTNNDDMILVDTTVEGTVNNAGGSTVTVLGTVDFNGLVSGPGNFFGPGTANFNGGMALGASTAEVTVEGSVVFGASNTLFIELAGDGGVAGIDFDQLVVDSNVTLAGMLDVSLISPFTLSPGQSFEIIDVDGSLSGTFSGLAEGGLVGNFGGTNLLITYAGGDGNDVTLLSALPGDFDIDGDVDGNDLLLWQRDPSVGSLADWEANYGMVVPLSATSAAVPEPSALLLGAMASLVGISRRRR